MLGNSLDIPFAIKFVDQYICLMIVGATFDPFIYVWTKTFFPLRSIIINKQLYTAAIKKKQQKKQETKPHINIDLYIICTRQWNLYKWQKQKGRYKKSHFPNKEIDFYNWRQLRHTVEFIFAIYVLNAKRFFTCIIANDW